MAIRDWPIDARPREKLLKQGASALTDAELVAVFLRTGVVGKSAVDLGRELIERFSGLGGLCRADKKSACAAPGVGEAKYALLQAVMEMARRDTFIIDPQGRVAKHYESVNPEGHSQVVLGDIKALKAAGKT